MSSEKSLLGLFIPRANVTKTNLNGWTELEKFVFGINVTKNVFRNVRTKAFRLKMLEQKHLD